MIKLKVDEKEFNIVNGYEELSLGQYVDIVKVSESGRFKDSTESDIEIISSLSDDKEGLKKVLWDFTSDDFQALKEEFKWVETDIDIVESFNKLEPKKSVSIENKEYAIISNYNKMSLGEIVSFETLMGLKSSDFHRLEVAFGVLLRPIGADGNLVKFTEDIFLDVINNKYKIKMSDVYSTLNFFLSGDKISTTKVTKGFSIQRV